MRHPFGGLLPGAGDDPGACDRRRLLQALVAGSVAGVAAGAWQEAAAEEKTDAQEEAKTKQNAAKGSGHRLYVVVPKDLRRFGTKRRMELGVWGPYFPLQRPKKQPQAGFLAWLTAEQAKKLAGNDAVAEVVLLEGKLIPGPGPQPKGVTQLLVELGPNSFPRKPAGHYEDTDTVLHRWMKQLSCWSNVPIEMGPLSGRDGYVLIRLPMNQGLKDVLQVVKSHPQVIRVQWCQPQPTTLALGEEGGPRPTTARGREEGGGITTQALGEEGGPATTRALGEEGRGGPLTPVNGEPGSITTKALHEEGAVTTFALGEEGGPNPPARGRITTQALGEEGGPRPKPRGK